MRYLVTYTFTFYQKYATGNQNSLCVIAVSKSHELLSKVRRLSSFFFDDDAYAFTSTRRNLRRNDAGDSTSTTSRCYFHDVGHYAELKQN